MKADDFRLKNLTASNRWCDFCDLPEVEDAKHMNLNCPGTRDLRNRMFESIEEIVDGNRNYEQIPFVDRCQILLGATVDGLALQQMVDIWLISTFHIGIMYKQRVKSRKAIG